MDTEEAVEAVTPARGPGPGHCGRQCEHNVSTLSESKRCTDLLAPAAAPVAEDRDDDCDGVLRLWC